jgi:hypothetical protein
MNDKVTLNRLATGLPGLVGGRPTRSLDPCPAP